MSPEARRALAVLEKGWRVPDWPSGYWASDVPAYERREAEFERQRKERLL